MNNEATKLNARYVFLLFRDPKCLNLPVIQGFILNIPGDYKLMFVQLLLRRKHWVAIREINGSYYNLDSKLDSPELIGKVRFSQIQPLEHLSWKGSTHFNFLFI